ncbi:hypothetical protein GCM10020001_061110 [Nonomuraea salmonea]
MSASGPEPTTSLAAATVAMPAPASEGSGTRTTSGSSAVGASRPRTVEGKTIRQFICVPPTEKRLASDDRVANTSGEVATTLSSAGSALAPCWRASLIQAEESAIQPSGRSRSTPARSPMSVRRTVAGGCSVTWTSTHRPPAAVLVALNASAASMTAGAMSTAAATSTRTGSRVRHSRPPPPKTTTRPAATIATAVSPASMPRLNAFLRRCSGDSAAWCRPNRTVNLSPGGVTILPAPHLAHARRC